MEIGRHHLGMDNPLSLADDGGEFTLREYCLMIGGYAYFQSMIAACHAGLFDYLETNPGQSAAAISEHLRIPEHALRVLLLACCALRLVVRDKESGLYRNAPFSSMMLCKGSPGSIVPILEAQHRLQYQSLYYLDESIKSGKNAGLKHFPGEGDTVYERTALQPELEKVFHAAMDCMSKQNIGWLEVPDLAKVKHVVDLGGGSGENAIAFARRYPEARATIFDLPSVCAIADKRIDEAGLSDRIDTMSGNFVEDRLPTDVDAFMLHKAIHIHSEEANAKLVRRCAEALRPGGRVFIFDQMCNDDETGGLLDALLSVYFVAVASGKGMVYPFKSYARWFEQAGFSALHLYQPQGVVGVR